MESINMKKELTYEVIFQYRGYEVNMERIMKNVRQAYTSKGYDEASIESVQIYIKPEDFTVYYVINDNIYGKVGLF